VSGDSNRLDRRNVLKTIGSAAIAGIGLTATDGSAGAFDTPHRLGRAYSDERRLSIALQQHAGGVRQTLVDEEIVAEDFDFGALDFEIDESVNGLEARTGDHSAAVTAHSVDRTMTAIGVVKTSTDTHDIRLYVQPERDESYAIVESKDGDEQFIATESDLEDTECQWSECTDSCCKEDHVYEEQWNCTVDSSGSCTDCYIEDTVCGSHNYEVCDSDGLCEQ
jgi:hypothetical protein